LTPPQLLDRRADPADTSPTSAARYAWALLLARIYEVFPLVCPLCGAEMRIIAFLTDPAAVRAILVHLGEPTAPPRIAPARGPTAVGPARCRDGWPRPQHPAGTGVRVRSTHRLVTPTVDPPRTTLGRRVPEVAKRAIPAR
jgi:hypothetical protein